MAAERKPLADAFVCPFRIFLEGEMQGSVERRFFQRVGRPLQFIQQQGIFRIEWRRIGRQGGKFVFVFMGYIPEFRYFTQGKTAVPDLVHEKFMVSDGLVQEKQVEAEIQIEFAPFTEVFPVWNPRSPDVVVALLAPFFQFVSENEGVELVDQHIFVFFESRIEIL